DRQSLVREFVFLAPRRQHSQETAIDMRRVGAGMSPNLFEIHMRQAIRLVNLVQPGAELHEPHTAAVISAGLQIERARNDVTFTAYRKPAFRAEVQHHYLRHSAYFPFSLSPRFVLHPFIRSLFLSLRQDASAWATSPAHAA